MADNFGFLHTLNTNINNVRKNGSKNSFSRISACKGGSVRRFFQVSIIHPKNITVGFTIFQWNSLQIRMRNDFNFLKSICQVKYGVFRDWALHIFYIFHIHLHIIRLSILKSSTNNFPLGYTHASHNYSYILNIFSLFVSTSTHKVFILFFHLFVVVEVFIWIGKVADDNHNNNELADLLDWLDWLWLWLWLFSDFVYLKKSPKRRR